jgi:hypothetical protein
VEKSNIKIVLKSFGVPLAKAAAEIITLNHGNTILNKEG